eukprot:GEZU01024373.1.p1 GENE.GEZU01024373.1~~GEZU01024373.1.p1  ORF type:complete len:434 (+),score=151.79 GEZU01024373.1:368-1669(+)
MKDHEALNQTTISLSKQLEESIKTCSHWMAENSAKKMELSLKEEAISNLRADLQKATKVKEGLLRKVRQLEEEKMEVEKSKEGLRGMISNLEREIEKLNKQSEWERKQIEDLTHQRDILEKKLRNEQIDTKKKGSLIKISDNHKKNLEREMQEYRKEAEKQRKEIYKLEKEREAYAAASAEATQKWYQALEEVKIKQMTIADYQKKIQDGEAKLKQQQQLYEAVRSDRNLYSKNLIEAQEEIAEMERKFKIMNHQIEQLKDEIAAKEKALVNEHFTVEKITKARENLQEEIQRLNHLIETAKKTNESNAAEIEKLNAIIDEAEQERQRQKKDLAYVMLQLPSLSPSRIFLELNSFGVTTSLRCFTRRSESSRARSPRERSNIASVSRTLTCSNSRSKSCAESSTSTTSKLARSASSRQTFTHYSASCFRSEPR